jgi:PAS domain S-box-containing protein
MYNPQKIPIEEQFRIMADNAPVLIWISDVDKLCYFFNKGWLDFTGRTLDQEYGNGWAEGVHPDDLERCLEIYMGSFDNRKPFKMEYRLRRHDGQFRWLLDTGVPRYTENGEFAGYIGSCIDIQEMKETELAKDEFISLAGHELKTPLTTLMVSAQLLDKLFSTDATSDYIPQVLQTSKSSIKKLETIINDLLDVGVIKDGRMQLHMTNFKFDQLINECRSYFELTSTKKFVITGNWSITVCGDAKKIEQVLMNMLHNALKYAPSSEQIVIHIEETSEFVKVSVQDSGPGIPAESLPFIFDRYYRGGKRLNNHTSGFGLGLYISREIVRQHNGEMGVDSKVGEGSTFWFTLPAHTPYKL